MFIKRKRGNLFIFILSDVSDAELQHNMMAQNEHIASELQALPQNSLHYVYADKFKMLRLVVLHMKTVGQLANFIPANEWQTTNVWNDLAEQICTVDKTDC